MKDLLHRLHSEFDLSLVGFDQGNDADVYFCTPVSSHIIGQAGVDGIHFCTIEGFGEMVFAVSPMNGPGEYVHPVAYNFREFLCLLLSCHDTAALEQCWFMDRERFEQFCADNLPEPKARACLQSLQEELGLTPIDDPYGYIRKLQMEFDYSAIPFSEEYYEIVPPEDIPTAPDWKVISRGDLIDGDSDLPGAEPVMVDVAFQWAGIDWFLPEIYSFSDSLSVYVLGRIATKSIPSFPVETPEDRERMEERNPANIRTRFEVQVGGLRLSPCGSTGAVWYPEDGENLEVKWVLEHYGMDLSQVWLVTRADFLWPGDRPLDLEQVTFTIRQNPISRTAARFITPLEGERVVIRHPKTGVEYTLYVDELSQEAVEIPDRDGMVYPTKYTRMTYRFLPELDRRMVRIVDCAGSDAPRKGRRGGESNGSIGIIGGADGPVVMLLSNPHQTHMVCSSLHFENPEQIQWRVIFQEVPNEPLTISLL